MIVDKKGQKIDIETDNKSFVTSSLKTLLKSKPLVFWALIYVFISTIFTSIILIKELIISIINLI